MASLHERAAERRGEHWQHPSREKLGLPALGSACAGAVLPRSKEAPSGIGTRTRRNDRLRSQHKS